MTTQQQFGMVPQPPAGPPPSQRPASSFFAAVRRLGLTRTPDRWVGGVAAGIAHRFGWDPMIVRGLFFISMFMGGFGFLLYGLGWALLPEAGDGRIHLQEALHGHFDPALLGAGLFALSGLTSSGSIFRFAIGHGLGLLVGLGWTAFWMIAIWLFVSWLRHRRLPRVSITVNRGAAPFPNPAPTGTTTGTSTLTPTATSSQFQWQWESSPTLEPLEPLPMPRPNGIDSSMGTDGIRQQRNEHEMATLIDSDSELDYILDDADDVKVSAAPVPQPERHELFKQQKAQAKYQKAWERSQTPVVKGPGKPFTMAVLGILLVLFAASLTLDGWEVSRALLGVGIVTLGLSSIISGIRGRSSGFLGFLSVIGLIISLSTLSLPANPPVFNVIDPATIGWEPSILDSNTVMLGSDATFRPVTRAEVEAGYRVALGNGTLDLSEFDFSGVTASDPIVVPIQLTAGNFDVIIPDDIAVTVDSRVFAGNIDQRFTARSGDAVLVLLLEVRAGNITITDDASTLLGRLLENELVGRD